jgi:two-component system phosphate regulon sensor histidine kinase PhoR
MRQPLLSTAIVAALLFAGALLAWSLNVPPIGLFIMIFAGAAAAIAAAMLAVPVRSVADAPVAPPPPAAEPPLYRHHGFDALFDALPLPLLLVRDGRVDAANAEARGLLGDFIVGADVRAAIRHPAAADLLTAPPGEATTISDLVGIGRSGQRWEMRVMPLDGGNRLVGLTDLTARDAVERMRADFVANASHELRTPLAVILGFVETLSDPAAGSDAGTRQRFLGVIDKEARRMQRLVDDLLSISRIEASKGQQPEEQINPAVLAREVVGELTASADPRAADILFDATEAEMLVRADRAQLSQLIHNLVGNAMKYGRAGTAVRLAVSPVEGMVEISVQDEGDGIPREMIPRLTERFFRVDSARSRSLGGTGLGLAIVKHVTERHRGRLDIQSEEGVGTIVRVRLPLA